MTDQPQSPPPGDEEKPSESYWDAPQNTPPGQQGPPQGQPGQWEAPQGPAPWEAPQGQQWGAPQGQPQWGQPQYGAPYGSKPNAPGAVAALVLGIIGIVACGLLAPFAWWQGVEAGNKIKQNPGMYDGEGMATAGKILGMVGTGLLVVGVLFLLVVVAAGV